MIGDAPAVIMVAPPWSVCNALGAARSLGREGVPVICLLERKGHPVAWSRYARSVEVCRGAGWTLAETDEEAIVDGLLRIGDKHAGPLFVVPTGDSHALLLAKHADRFDARFLWHRNSLQTIERFTSKPLAYRLAGELGIRTPATAIVHSTADLDGALDRVPGPWLVKPAGRHLAGERGITSAKVGQYLGAKAVLMQIPEEVRGIVKVADAEGEPVVIQEYVPGADDHVYVISPYLRDQDPCPVVVAQKLRQYPRQFGYGCYDVSVPTWQQDSRLSQAVAWSVGFARAAGFHGICNVEWKRHEGNGQYYFIEANPRICQFNILYSRAGLNLLLWQYTELVLGREPECDLTATGTRHFFCEELSDLRAYAAGGGTPFLRWLTYGRTIGKPVEFGFFARDDPLPGVVALVEDLAVTVKRSLIRRRKHRPGEDMLS